LLVAVGNEQAASLKKPGVDKVIIALFITRVKRLKMASVSVVDT